LGETYCKYNSFRSFFSIFILGVIQQREDDKELELNKRYSVGVITKKTGGFRNSTVY